MDRISSLPNELLCHILSFLTTKEAFLTSVLSKRWRDLLAFVPCLDIDDSFFLHPENAIPYKHLITPCFMNFVDKVLALQGDFRVKKVTLKCRTRVDPDRAERWIHNVCGRGVSHLILNFKGRGIFQVAPIHFKSSTLVKLEIVRGIDLGFGWVADSIFLPMLKTLLLDSTRVDNFDILLRALPVLEELVLINVIWEDLDVSISSATLKTLTMQFVDHFTTLSLDTPNLDYLFYSGFTVNNCPVVRMENLFEAQIDLLEDDEDDADDVVALRLHNFGKLMNGICNVQCLVLFPDTLEFCTQVLSLPSESMPVFNNLKSLTIKSHIGLGWQAMPVLLRNCSHLETLVIEGLLHYVTDECGDACDCIPREDKGRSLTSSPVKMLEIQGFRGTMKEMGMIKHFLDHFSCLKEMKIYVEENVDTELKVPEVVMEMIEDYNKSSSCNVQFLGMPKKLTAKRSL